MKSCRKIKALQPLGEGKKRVGTSLHFFCQWPPNQSIALSRGSDAIGPPVRLNYTVGVLLHAWRVENGFALAAVASDADQHMRLMASKLAQVESAQDAMVTLLAQQQTQIAQLQMEVLSLGQSLLIGFASLWLDGRAEESRCCSVV